MTISRQPRPTDLIKGVDTPLVLSLLDDAGDLIDVASGTITVYKGVTNVVSGSVTVNGGVASYTVAAADTEDGTVGEYSATWRAVWAVTDTDGNAYTVRQACVLVNAALFSPITDDDLIEAAPSLADMVPPDAATYETFRVAAFNRLVRKLKRNGKIAALVLDADALVDVLIADTLAMIYREHVTAMGDQRYAQQAAYWQEQSASEWGAFVVQYDRTGVGGPTGPDDSASGGVAVLFTARPPRRTPRNAGSL